MKTVPGIKLIHALPGRVRLQSPRLKGNPGLTKDLVGRLQALPTLTQVSGNPATGSLLILFEPSKALAKQSLRQLTGVLKFLAPELGSPQVSSWLQPQISTAGPPAPLAASITHFFGGLNAVLRNYMGGIDLKVLLPASLFVLGIRGMITEKATPPAWYNLLWFALSTFVMFHTANTSIMAETEAVHATGEGMAALEFGD